MIARIKKDPYTDKRMEALAADNAELKQKLEEAEVMTDDVILLIADLIGGSKI